MRISDWSSDVCSSDLIVPTLDYTDTDIFTLTDPLGWGNNGTQQVVQAGFLNRPSFKDDLKSLRASLNGEFADSVVSGWEVGANFSRRKKTSAYASSFLCPTGAGENCTETGRASCRERVWQYG